MINSVIFDLDGVICSTDEYHYQAWKMLADRLDIPFDREINNRLRGISRMDSLDIILENADREYSDEEKLALATEKNDNYLELLNQMTPEDVDPEVLATLNEIRRRGYRMAIGSSSKNARTILERIGLEDFFDAVSDGTNITRSKPDPEVFLKAAEFLGAQPEDCLVVEDAIAGIQAAKSAGMAAAGIGEAKDYSLTDYPLNHFRDLLDILPTIC